MSDYLLGLLSDYKILLVVLYLIELSLFLFYLYFPVHRLLLRLGNRYHLVELCSLYRYLCLRLYSVGIILLSCRGRGLECQNL